MTSSFYSPHHPLFGSLADFVAQFNPQQRWQRSYLRKKQRKLATSLRQIDRMRQRVLRAAERYRFRPAGGAVRVVRPTDGRPVRVLLPFGFVGGPDGWQALWELWLAEDTGALAREQAHQQTLVAVIHHLALEQAAAEGDLELVDRALAQEVRS